ncbi:fam-a protein, fragment [Plasmodium vinckei lentum]|uniref:Fam-a protein n=1 Tax=Plasmodium vinckei lentum TaxID=138297 RepID=A0A6V7RV14_PLAVN|nr:fam-a protein, fragment [Plasmodium vinckei lentum]
MNKGYIKTVFSNENYENEDLVTHPDSEETEKAEEIRDKYNEILNELNKAKDIYWLGYNGKFVREYYPNLIMLQKYDQSHNAAYNQNCFYLSATVKVSEYVTTIANTLIDLNYNHYFDKKNKKKLPQKAKSCPKIILIGTILL